MGLIATFIAIWFIVYFIMTLLGIESEYIALVSFIFTSILVVGAILFKPLKQYRLTATYQPVFEHYRERIKDSEPLTNKFNTTLKNIRDALPDDERTCENVRELLKLPILKGTVFYNYFGELYATIEGLAMLSVQRDTWQESLLHNPYELDLLKSYDNMSEPCEAVFAANPWLVQLDLYDKFKYVNPAHL